MVYDWIHRRLIDGFINQKGISYDPEFNKRIGQDNFAKDRPIKMGHRYRYFIPQLNTSENTVNNDILNNSLSKEIKSITNNADKATRNKITPVDDCHSSQNFCRLKILLIIPTSNDITKEQDIAINTIRNMYPTLKRYLVIPLQNSELNENSKPKTLKKCNEKCVIEHLDGELGYDFENEMDYKQKYSGGDYLLNTPFLEHKRTASSTEEDLKSENKRPTFYYQDQNEDFESLYMDDGWFGDISYQIPAIHDNFKCKIDETSENQKCNSSFIAMFKNFFFKVNTDERNINHQE